MELEKKTVFEEGQVLLFDKPLYWTSFDLVNKIRIMIRSSLGVKKIKVGHAGTLDPLATGLMIVCTGKATKSINGFMDFDKEYIAKFCLGGTTPSFDMETEVDAVYPTDHITKGLVENKLLEFIGPQKQLPPLHSAKFIDGKRAYEYARKGIDIEIKPSDITITELELINFGIPTLEVRIRCSKGTYIRSLARDLGKSLGTGAYLSSLVRTAIGPYKIENAINLEIFENILLEVKQNQNLPV